MLRAGSWHPGTRAAQVTRAFQAPGRVNLIGEHTDYSGGLVLPAAIDRAIVIEAELGGDRIVLTSDRADEPVDVPADGSHEPAAGWGRYVAAVAAELDALGRRPVGLRGRVRSDLPEGAGLSSSAALEVVVAIALCAAADLTLPPLEVAAVGQRAEHRAVGVPCGIMDQAASVLGLDGHAVLLDCATLEHRAVPLPDDVALLIVDSGVVRRLEESGYARRREELESAMTVLAGRAPGQVAGGELTTLLGALDPVPARRLRHVVTENARVRAVETALTAQGGADWPALDALFDAGHASLRDDFEVSTPELDDLVDLAKEAGAFAARMTGGGFGGAIVALVEAGAAERIGQTVLDAYHRRHLQAATVHVCRAAAGAGEILP